jgi:hypothetical protein
MIRLAGGDRRQPTTIIVVARVRLDAQVPVIAINLERPELRLQVDVALCRT